MTRLSHETSYFPLGRLFLSLLFPPAGDMILPQPGQVLQIPRQLKWGACGCCWRYVCLFVACLFVQGGKATAGRDMSFIIPKYLREPGESGSQLCLSRVSAFLAEKV